MFLRLFKFIFVDLLVQRTIRGNTLGYARKVTRFRPWPIKWELSCSSKCHAGILSSIGSGDHCALSHLTTCTDWKGLQCKKVGFKGLALKGSLPEIGWWDIESIVSEEILLRHIHSVCRWSFSWLPQVPWCTFSTAPQKHPGTNKSAEMGLGEPEFQRYGR